MLPTELRHIIRYLRIKRKWTQKDLAKKSGVSNVAISEIETGETKVPEMTTVQKIADAFNMEISDLLNYNIDEIDDTNLVKEKEETYRDEILGWAIDPGNRLFLEFMYNHKDNVTKEDFEHNRIRIIKDLT